MRRTFALALLVLGLLAAAAGPAGAASGSDYLRSRLTRSGGIVESGSSTPSVSLTQWSVMGLTAAGRRPWLMRVTGGHTPAYFLAHRAGRWATAYELARGVLAAVALNRDPRQFGGRNLVRALRRKIDGTSGRIGRYSNSTYWGVIALRAARAQIPRHRWPTSATASGRTAATAGRPAWVRTPTTPPPRSWRCGSPASPAPGRP